MSAVLHACVGCLIEGPEVSEKRWPPAPPGDTTPSVVDVKCTTCLVYLDLLQERGWVGEKDGRWGRTSSRFLQRLLLDLVRTIIRQRAQVGDRRFEEQLALMLDEGAFAHLVHLCGDQLKEGQA